MANLVQQHYLHSHKWTFFNNAQISGLDPKTFTKGSLKLDRLINGLQKTQSTMIQREKAFYADFKVANNIEWANKYLLRSGETSERNIILGIINSPTMISILSTGGQDFEASRRGLVEYFEKMLTDSNSNIPVELVRYVLDKAISTNAIDITEFFADLKFIGKGNTNIGGTTMSNKDIQQKLFSAMAKTSKNFKAPSRILTSVHSTYIKAYEQQITKILAKERERATRASNYLQEQLRLKGISEEKIKIIVQAFNKELNKNLRKGKENRLVSSAVNNVTGEVSEVGEVIAYIDFDDPFKKDKNGRIIDINSMVKQLGRDQVDRNGHQVKSKVDTVWTGPTSKKKYYIQNKNSNAEIYRQFQITNDFEKLLNVPSFLTIQSTANLSYLMEQFTNYGILSEEDKDSLIYLLINYNVLNKFGDEENRLAKGSNDNGIPPAYRTQAAIDQFISQGLQYFLSDLLPQQYIKDNGDIASNTIDFFIFMDRFLLPKSTIVANLIQFLQDYKNRTLGIFTTSNKGSFSASNYGQMLIEKQQAREEERQSTKEKIKYDYHNENLVQAGSNWGQVAYDSIKISKISVKFTIQNLIAKSLI